MNHPPIFDVDVENWVDTLILVSSCDMINVSITCKFLHQRLMDLAIHPKMEKYWRNRCISFGDDSDSKGISREKLGNCVFGSNSFRNSFIKSRYKHIEPIGTSWLHIFYSLEPYKHSLYSLLTGIEYRINRYVRPITIDRIKTRVKLKICKTSYN